MDVPVLAQHLLFGRSRTQHIEHVWSAIVYFPDTLSHLGSRLRLPLVVRKYRSTTRVARSICRGMSVLARFETALRPSGRGVNSQASTDGFPIVRITPLPTGAQFLNVIESVFSGMAKAIIHNSDYQSVQAAQDAINRYFEDRNEQFSKHPKRAGNKIWSRERVPSEFSEAHNCKDPRYR